MIFQEPKVEFVSIDLTINAEHASCPAGTTFYGTGGGQYCRASQVDAAYCKDWVNDIDWEATMPPDEPTPTPGS